MNTWMTLKCIAVQTLSALSALGVCWALVQNDTERIKDGAEEIKTLKLHCWDFLKMFKKSRWFECFTLYVKRMIATKRLIQNETQASCHGCNNTCNRAKTCWPPGPPQAGEGAGAPPGAGSVPRADQSCKRQTTPCFVLPRMVPFHFSRG